MAPMIDMVFLLLVFFMCVSTLAIAEKSRPVELAESRESKVPEDLSDRVTISVEADGTVFVGMDPATFDALRDRLQARLSDRGNVKVHVRADQRVPYGEIKKALRLCAEAGASEVVYATHQSD